MKLYIDIDTKKVRSDLNGPDLVSLIFFLRDILNPLEIVYIQGGAIITSTILASSAVQRVGLKATPDGDLLAGASTYVLSGGVSQVIFSLNTTELIAYFLANVSAGARESQFIFEVETTSSDASARETRAQLTVTVRRDVNRATDATPSAAHDLVYVLRGELFDDDGFPITPHFPCVRPDITTYTAVRAIATEDLTRPTMYLFLIGGAWECWTFRAKGGGESDDGITYLVPNDSTTGIFIKTPIN